MKYTNGRQVLSMQHQKHAMVEQQHHCQGFDLKEPWSSFVVCFCMILGDCDSHLHNKRFVLVYPPTAVLCNSSIQQKKG